MKRKVLILKHLRPVLTTLKQFFGVHISEFENATVEALAEMNDAKEDRHDAIQIVIPAEGWKSDDVVTYPFFLDVTLEGVGENDRVDVTVIPGSLGAAEACGLCPATESLEGKVRLRAARSPNTEMAAECWIENGKETTKNMAWGNVNTSGDLGNSPVMSDATPKALGVAAAGVLKEAARADHVHPKQTAADIGALDKDGTAKNSEKLNGKAVGEILLLSHPVGSIYESDDATSPAELFGGSWERIKGRVIVGADETYEAGSTGGEADTTLVAANLPHMTGQIFFHGSSNATMVNNVNGVFSSGVSAPKYVSPTNPSDTAKSVGRIDYDNGGSNESFTNMPPYYAAYIWKRVA